MLFNFVLLVCWNYSVHLFGFPVDITTLVLFQDLGFGCPQLILAQTPLQNTVNDFWNMIWSQKANVVVCLHTPNEVS